MAIPIMSYLLYFFGTHKNFMVCIFFQKKIHEPNDKLMNQLAMSYKHGISKHKEKLFQLCFLLCKMISNFSKASKTGINYQMTHSLRITNTDSESSPYTLAI